MFRIQNDINRREFMKKAGAGTGLLISAAGLPLMSFSKEKTVRLGFVGVGARGIGMLRIALSIPGVEIVAVCDLLEDRVERAQRMVEGAGQPKPEGYSRGPEDFKRLVEQANIDAVYTATPWKLHAPVMIAAMKAGKFGGTEMPACNGLDEAWELVETAEKTGQSCMLMENYCYMKDVQMILNMVRQNAFGDLSHCEVGYQHDTRYVSINAKGELLWRAEDKIKHNGNRYPTHAIGPASQWLNINRGDKIDYLVSMSSRQVGMSHYASRIAGTDHPSAKTNFKLGDVNTTLIKTHSGITITLYYDTQTSRPVDFIWRVQGTKGIYSGTLNKIHLEDRSKPHQWEEVDKYMEEYNHPNWKKYEDLAKSHGHGGSDYLCMLDFVKAVRNRSEFPIDVYDAATWSVITELTEQSVNNKSQAVDVPDFTRGKWKSRNPSPIEAI